MLSTTAGSFFFPGFIDTHIHASQYPNVGIFGDSTLLDWLNKYTFPLESSLEDTKLAKEVYSKVVDRTLENGTTTATYYATIHADATGVLADEALSKNQRAFIGRVCMVQHSPDFYRHTEDEAKIEETKLIEHIRKIDPGYEIVSPIITPRFAPSCTENMLKWLGDLAKKEQLPVQTHVSENHDEIKWVGELFPEADSYTDVYHRAGLLNEKTVLAHAVHLSEAEKNLIKTQEAGISHCPISNSSISSGLAPVRSLLNKGIKVGLGTDISGGYSPSILEVARQALLVSRELAHFTKNDEDKLSVAEVLYLATVGGAKVCGLEDKVGNFAVGKKWDAQHIDILTKGSRIDIFPWTAPKDKYVLLDYYVQKWLFLGDDRNCRQVWVAGKSVVDKS